MKGATLIEHRRLMLDHVLELLIKGRVALSMCTCGPTS